MELRDAVYVLAYNRNLVSVARLKKVGVEIRFGEKNSLTTSDGTWFHIEQENNLFVWRIVPNLRATKHETCLSSKLSKWHDRLGHNNWEDLKKLKQCVVGMDVSENDVFVCEVCEVNKAKRRPVPKDCITRANETLDYVHFDVLEPVSPVSVDDHKYAIGFQGSYSRYGKVYFMKNRDEVTAKLEQHQKGKPIVIVTDCAKEFVGGDKKTFCRNNGIRQETSAPYTPEENGKIERVWGTICGMARCMIQRANMDKEYWTYALSYAFYIKNLLLHTGTKQTPFERMYGERPNLSFIKVFGGEVYSFVEKQFRGKFDERAKVEVFLGFAENSKIFIVIIRKRCNQNHQD